MQCSSQLTCVFSAPYEKKKTIIKLRGLMSTKESSKIGTFPETTIHDMVYFIAAYFQKKKQQTKQFFMLA